MKVARTAEKREAGVSNFTRLYDAGISAVMKLIKWTVLSSDQLAQAPRAREDYASPYKQQSVL